MRLLQTSTEHRRKIETQIEMQIELGFYRCCGRRSAVVPESLLIPEVETSTALCYWVAVFAIGCHPSFLMGSVFSISRCETWDFCSPLQRIDKI